ncbi:MAG: Fibronectin type III domain protein [Candidatus Moranbacteria bacterium GW2011_GWE1_36_7]|nr:MAG: Fibronectin type III domain protein [Candidatus Moranbacteria bacterium GW2011_GWD2_36_12]KKQ04793.1 MAG: Fibronectin type III domain protein [Candidatus Moranbacteria bacterium GW2011_GWE2_36_40]KKQ12733.1 MAG: Fibronectin type III domain protein [Candidatus Moranbacteria bacterium GW2011_GWE1_36_7]
MQKQILKIYPARLDSQRRTLARLDSTRFLLKSKRVDARRVKLFTKLNLFYSTRSLYLTGVFLSLAIFFMLPKLTRAEVIFEDNFDAQDDFWYVQARPDGSCSEQMTSPARCIGHACDQYGRLVTNGSVCIPEGWSGVRNEEAWNPYDVSGSTAQVPGSHSTLQISSENYAGTSGKGVTIYNESFKGWDGTGWGADTVLAKKFTQDYPELYVRFKYKLQPDAQFTSYNGGAQMKMFRIEHNDWNAPSMFLNFDYGYNAPMMLVQVGAGWDGTTPLLGSSHQTRCDPQGDSVNYGGVTYRVLLNHLSSEVNVPQMQLIGRQHLTILFFLPGNQALITTFLIICARIIRVMLEQILYLLIQMAMIQLFQMKLWAMAIGILSIIISK